MKTFFFFLLSCLLSISAIHASVRTVVSGKIVNPQSKTAAVTIFRNFVNYDQRVETAVLNDNGQFKITLKLANPTAAGFVHAGKEANIYLTPGDSIYVLFDPARLVETIRFSGRGANENNLLASFQRFERLPAFDDSIQLPALATEEEFRSYADYKRKRLLDLLFASGKKRPVAKHFREYIIADINYSWANLMFAYPKLHAKMEAPAPLSEGYYGFINTIKINNDKAMGCRSYIRFLDNYISTIIDENPDTVEIARPERAALYLQQYYSYRAAFKGEVQAYVLSKLLVESFQKGKIELMEESYRNFKAINTLPAYEKIVSRAYTTRQEMAPGNPAPDFTLTNDRGEKVSLKDFRGKVVYLNFWASWCIPCMSDQLDTLKEKFENNIVFLNVSLDQHEHAWRSLIERTGREGEHLLAKEGFNGTVAKLYHISSVPSYWLIDLNGNLITHGFVLTNDDIEAELEAILGR
jgi:thiol-disulfide isomerase/thioredoxin